MTYTTIRLPANAREGGPISGQCDTFNVTAESAQEAAAKRAANIDPRLLPASLLVTDGLYTWCFTIAAPTIPTITES